MYGQITSLGDIILLFSKEKRKSHSGNVSVTALSGLEKVLFLQSKNFRCLFSNKYQRCMTCIFV